MRTSLRHVLAWKRAKAYVPAAPPSWALPVASAAPRRSPSRFAIRELTRRSAVTAQASEQRTLTNTPSSICAKRSERASVTVTRGASRSAVRRSGRRRSAAPWSVRGRGSPSSASQSAPRPSGVVVDLLVVVDELAVVGRLVDHPVAVVVGADVEQPVVIVVGVARRRPGRRGRCRAGSRCRPPGSCRRRRCARRRRNRRRRRRRPRCPASPRDRRPTDRDSARAGSCPRVGDRVVVRVGVADVAAAVAVDVGLRGVADVRAVVDGVHHAVAVDVVGLRVRERGRRRQSERSGQQPDHDSGAHVVQW